MTTLPFLAGCKEKPAATVKEVNALDAKSPDAPNPVEDPRFKEFFDHVRAYIKIHDAADARVPSLKETSDPRQVSGREKALADEIRIERAGAHQGDVFSPSAAREIGDIVAEDFNVRPVKDQTRDPGRGASEGAAGHQYRLSHSAAAGDRATRPAAEAADAAR